MIANNYANCLSDVLHYLRNIAMNNNESEDDEAPFVMISESSTPGFSETKEMTNTERSKSEYELELSATDIDKTLDSDPSIDGGVLQSLTLRYKHTLSTLNTKNSNNVDGMIFEPDELGIDRMDNNVYKDCYLLFDDINNWWVDKVYYDNIADRQAIDFSYEESFVYYGVIV